MLSNPSEEACGNRDSGRRTKTLKDGLDSPEAPPISSAPRGPSQHISGRKRAEQSNCFEASGRDTAILARKIIKTGLLVPHQRQ